MTDPKPLRVAKGTIAVRADVCKGCAFCVEFCPPHCISMSRDFNLKGYHYPVLTTPEACTGCDLCGLYCPDFAIFGMRYKDLDKRVEQPLPALVAVGK